MIAQDLGNELRLVERGQPRQSDQQDAGVYQPLPKDEFAEILVLGQEQRRFFVGDLKHLVIGNTRVHLANRQDLMTIRPQLHDGGGVDILVGQQAHAACPFSGYTTSARKACAPKLTAASTDSRVSRGCSATSSSMDSPAPIRSRTN